MSNYENTEIQNCDGCHFEYCTTLEYSARAKKPSTSLVSPVVIINLFDPPKATGWETGTTGDVCRRLYSWKKSDVIYQKESWATDPDQLQTWRTSIILPCPPSLAKSKAVFDCLSLTLICARAFTKAVIQLPYPFKAAWNALHYQATDQYEHGFNRHWRLHNCLMQWSPVVNICNINFHSEAHKRFNAARMPIHSSLQAYWQSAKMTSL